MSLVFNQFRPIAISLQNVGPFRESVSTFKFKDAKNNPTNFMLFISQNGKGKTTILDTMTALMGMLGKTEISKLEQPDLATFEGRAQLDFLVTLTVNSTQKKVIFSLSAGYGEAMQLNPIMKAELKEFEAESWHRIWWTSDELGVPFKAVRIADSDLAEEINNEVCRQLHSKPSDILDRSVNLPTMIYFSCYRNIPKIIGNSRALQSPQRWHYTPAHWFGEDDTNWDDSIDNLLVWFTWLQEGKHSSMYLNNTIDFLNKHFFEGSGKRFAYIDRDPPRVMVSTEGEHHELWRLSSGEKSLFSLLVRIATSLTANTILLIDEIGVHLHPQWQFKILNILKSLARTYPGLTIIGTTHSSDIIKGFRHDVEEEGLFKSGYILD